MNYCIEVAPGTCGNGIQEIGEECDDDNITNYDGCTPTCALMAGWYVSDSNPIIMFSVCSDGIVAIGSDEECDD